MSDQTLPSLRTLSNRIAATDPWEMKPFFGVVRLAPCDSTASSTPNESSESNVQVNLFDLGFIDGGGCDGLLKLRESPINLRSEVVLLLPASLRLQIADLCGQARSSSVDHANYLQSQEWLPTWHRFIDVDEGLPVDLFDELKKTAAIENHHQSGTTSRRYVFGSLPQEQSHQNAQDRSHTAANSTSGEVDLRHPVFTLTDP
jgi:hypothetical protein